MEIRERLFDLVEHRRGIPIGFRGGQQPLLAEQLVGGVAAPPRRRKAAAGDRRGQRVVFELVIERRRGDHAQREMPGNQRGTPAIGRNQVAIRQPAVPHAQGALLGVDIQQRGAAEHLHREDLFELGIDLAKDVGAE